MRCYTAAAGTSYPHISTGAYTMELSAAKRAFNGLFLAHLLLVAHLVAADVVPSPDNGRSAAAAPGAYLGNAEPTIWRRPTILTIGDSITEGGLDPEGGWTVRLASAYARKADVVNRGFGGYTTATMLLSLPEILQSTSSQQIALATVWLGANDASMPDRANAAAHVPLDVYARNLVAIVQQLQAAGVQNILLVTPPPVNEAAPGAILPGESSPNRTFKFTARYAAAVRSIASQLSLPLLDVWKLFTQQQGWQQLLRTDGLHLNLDGQKAVFEELMKVVEHDVASVRPAALAWHHPTWWFVDYPGAKQQWAAEKAAYEAEFGKEAP